MSLSGLDDHSVRESYLLGLPLDATRETLNETSFRRRLAIERKRTERSKEPFLLMLLDPGNRDDWRSHGKTLDTMISVLALAIRDTDVVGWYKDRSTVGVIFTGLADSDKQHNWSVLLNRVSTIVRNKVTLEQFKQISISFHFFPDDWDHDKPGRPSDLSLYSDLSMPRGNRQFLLRVKQSLDMFGSLLLLVLCSPLLMMIAVAIKVSSGGPVLFRQQRVGQYGQTFTFLKFRSMRMGSDPGVHKEYISKVIAGREDNGLPTGRGDRIYKLTNDTRVTPLGKFLRKTSLDELPQLVNVLKGDMSLVGPRPPIPYEVAAYQIWHRRRLLEFKPGITGLWQVSGRCKMNFDEMVRLDLRYAASWSPWLDLKILLRTPHAVIGGAGAA